jgi:hypothetical protein
MDAAFVSRVLSLIPERAPRMQLGAPFLPEAGASRHPERVRHLAKFLHWLSPLTALDKEDQKILGLLNAAGRPMHSGDADDADLDEPMEIGDDGPDALEYMEAETAIGVPADLDAPAAAVAEAVL